MMKAGSDAQWRALSKEVWNEMKKWRTRRPRATLHAPVHLEMLAECDANFILTYPDDILSLQLICMAWRGEIYRDEVALVKGWKEL
jgi:hypothetical protein